MTVTAIILAGKRGGRIDPLAESAGVSLKCLVPIDGKPLIAHVAHSLAEAPSIGQVVVVGAEHDAVRACIEADLQQHGTRLRFVDAAPNIADSVLRAADGVEFPILITTADNVLMSAASVEEFASKCLAQPDLGAGVAMARREAVLAAHPQGQRKFYEFTDGAFSNCNLYWIGSRAALGTAQTFREGGQFVKFPMRIAKAFGIANLLRFKFGIGSAERFFSSISRRLGVRIALIEMSDGACAIDVDNERSYDVTWQVLRARQKQALAA